MLAAIAAVMGRAPASISAIWSDIGYASPTSSGTNEDRTITFGGGSRTITNSWISGGTLSYRIDSGSYVTYTQGGAGFSLTSGQTLGWRYQAGGSNVSANATVSVAGVALDTFAIVVTGF